MDGRRYPPFVRLFEELFYAAGPSQRELGDEMSGGIQPTPAPLLQPNQFTPTNRKVQLNPGAWALFSSG